MIETMQDGVRTFTYAKGERHMVTLPSGPVTPCICGLYSLIDNLECPYCVGAAKKLLSAKEQRGAPRTSREAIEQARAEFDAMAAEVRGPAPKVKRKSKKAMRLERAAGHGKNAVPQWLKDEDAAADAELKALTAGEIAS